MPPAWAPAGAPRRRRRPAVELADLFRAHGSAYRRTPALAQGNPRVLYTLLFRTVAATLTTFARDPRHLEGELGGTAILHTWGQTLSQHLHLHCVVPGGALTQDGTRWIAAPAGFLFPVRALAQVFRGKYLAALRRAFTTGQLVFAGSVASLAEPAAFAA